MSVVDRRRRNDGLRFFVFAVSLLSLVWVCSVLFSVPVASVWTVLSDEFVDS